MSEPEKAELKSMDVAEDKRQQMAQMFPEVITETRTPDGQLTRAVDFEKLKAVLGTFSEVLENQKERYGMTWPGKNECLKIIQQPSIATLKPCREESVNFDTTENLFIEGDNLEVLKLLQKAYYGKVKMIYIDPPYNTGKEFIYPDNYSETLDTYLAYSGQVDAEGRKFSTNTESEGRFHTKWMKMMYPRLFLARNLLSEDGVIFMSIDDHEIDNLHKLAREIFGDECFVAAITVLCNPKGRSQDKYFATNHEYLLVYSKNPLPKGFFSIAKDDDQIEVEYPEEDDDGKYRLLELRNTHREFGKHNRKNLYYPFYVNDAGDVFLEEAAGLSKVLPNWDDGFEGCWTWERPKAEKDIAFLVAQKMGDRWKIYRKSYASGADRMLKTILVEKDFYTERGQKAFNQLFNTKEKIFQSPKSPALLAQLIATCTANDSVILDFFSGSATTAHAILDSNKQDGGQRRFILVQLPEPCDEVSAAFKAGYKSIADIGKERIRRVIKKLNDEDAGKLDLDGGKESDRGFRVYKLDRSNFKVWDSEQAAKAPEGIAKQLELHEQHIDPHAGQEDILYELLLKSGFPLTTKVEKVQMAGMDIFSVADGALLICLEREITKELIKAMADADPLQVICLDEGFKANDQLKANAVQTFKARSQGKDKEAGIVFRTV